MPYLKMLWTTESPTPQIGSWDYWCSTANTILFNCGWNCTKVNNKIAYYGMYYTSETPFGRSATPILMSPDADAVTYDTGGAVASYRGTITDINGITWYYSGLQGFASQHPVPDCIISDEVYSSIHDAAQALLDRIYAVPFQHDFNVGQTYNMDITCSNMTFARKAIGIFLFKFISEYGTSVSYTALSNNVDTILNHFFDSNLVNFISLSIERIGGSADSIRLNSFFSDDTNPHTSYRISAAKDTISGFDYYFGRFDGFTYQGRYRRTDILSDGTITYSTPSASIAGFTIGVRIPDSSTYLLTSSNIGIDL